MLTLPKSQEGRQLLFGCRIVEFRQEVHSVGDMLQVRQLEEHMWQDKVVTLAYQPAGHSIKHLLTLK